MMIKKIISIFFLVFSLYSGYSQYTFQHIYRDPLPQAPGNIIERNNGDILFSIVTLFTEESKIMKLDKEGNIVDSLVISDTSNYMYTLLKYDENCFFICGQLNKNPSYYYVVRKYDYNFQLLDELIIPVSGRIFVSDNPVFVNKNNNLVISFRSTYETYHSYANFLEISPNCKIIKSKIFTSGPGSVPYEIIQKDSLYYVFYSSFLHNTEVGSILHKLDSSFNILHIYNTTILPGFGGHENARWINDSIILLCGENFRYVSSSIIQTQVIKIKVDTCFHYIKDTLFSRNDSSIYPGLKKNLDFIDLNNVFVGSTVSKGLANSLSKLPSRLVLTKLDTSLNVKWQKEYGGDAHYLLVSIKATQDGGCVLAATRYDYLTQNNETDPFIVKVDCNGNINWVYNLPDDFNKLTVYPNPASNQIAITLQGLQVLAGLNLKIYNIQGQLLLQQTLHQNNTEIDISQLQSGVYIAKINLSDGRFVQEKFVVVK